MKLTALKNQVEYPRYRYVIFYIYIQVYVILRLVKDTFINVKITCVISISALETKQSGDKSSAYEIEGPANLLFVVSSSFIFVLTYICILY